MTRAGLILILTLCLLLSACQTAGTGTGTGAGTDDSPDAGTDAETANPVAGAAIQTTTLDAPVTGLAQEQAADNPDPAPDTPFAPLAEQDATQTPPPAAVQAPEVIDPALLTPEAVACKRRGGMWSRIGEGNARACIKRTRDAGKRCDADRDCQGVCLARSGTCAPVDPLFGCNDVLQDDGRRMNLCLN